MSTFTSAIILDNGTDAKFRIWCQWIHDRLAAFGWVQTSDTGQINLTTVLAPTGGASNKGYEIWRMADALQATAPVFLKIAYGSTSGSNNPAIFSFQVGTGSDGAGNLTGQLGTGVGFGTTAPSTTVAYNCWASGDTDRFVMIMPSDVAVAAQNNCWIFGVERTKDAAGANTAEGIWWFYLSPNTGTMLGGHQTIPFSGAVPALESQWLCSSFPSAPSTGVVGADVYTFPIYPILGYQRNPIMNIVTYFNADITREVAFPLDMYGASHNYLPCGMFTSGGLITARDSKAGTAVARLAMRYE